MPGRPPGVFRIHEFRGLRPFSLSATFFSVGKPKDCDFPTRKNLDRLIAKIGPDLSRLFAEHGLRAEAAAARVRDGLLQLAFRWNKIEDRERWLLETIERAVREGPPAPRWKPRKETGHD